MKPIQIHLEGALFNYGGALSAKARAGIARLYSLVGLAEPRAWCTINDAALMFFRLRAAEDRPEFFPHGKWASIQALEVAIDDFYNRTSSA